MPALPTNTLLLFSLVILAGLVGLVLFGASLLKVRVEPAKVAVSCIAAIVVALLISLGVMPSLAQWVQGLNTLAQIVVLMIVGISIPIVAMAACLAVVGNLPQRQSYALSMFAWGGYIVITAVIFLAIASDATASTNMASTFVPGLGQVDNTLEAIKLVLWAYLVIGVGLIAASLWSGRAQVPGIPTGLTATAGEGTVTLKWQPVENAQSYRVKRGQSSGNYAMEAEVSGTSYTDRNLPGGALFHYAVAATNENGDGQDSGEVAIAAKDAALGGVFPPPPPPPPPSPVAGWLVLTGGPERGKTINIHQGVMRLGRKRDCEIALEDEQVSGHHAQLRIEGTFCRLNDLDSRNGTWLNGERVESARTLDDGDEIVVGQTKLIYKRV